MNGQVERHSISSLSLRAGMNRGVLLGALASGKLPVVERAKVGTRTIYDIQTEVIEDFVAGFRARLQARVERMTSNPAERELKTAQALREVRKNFQAETGPMTVDKLMDIASISREAAAYLLNKYGVRVENGWAVSPEAMRKIRRHIEETRGSGTIQNKGGVYVA
jgi:hypothetical protein